LFLIARLRHHSPPIQIGSGQPQSQQIVITPGEIDNLTAGFVNLWHHPPTPDETERLIQGRIREEVYYREALKMGLDRDDAIVRGRLQEKLEFLSQDVHKLPEPSEQDLNSFLAQHPEKFRADTRFTFRFVFIDAGRHGRDTVPYAERMLAKLGKSPGLDSTTIGDPLPFRSNCKRVSQEEVARQFGSEFTAAIPAMKVKQWSGPVKTGDGAYLVYLAEKLKGQLPPLGEIRGPVRNEWLAVQRQKINDEFYENLLRGYTVKIEAPPAARTQVGIDPPPR
jgi:hypothetical protein